MGSPAAPLDLSRLTADVFASRVGDVFTVWGVGADIALSLAEVERTSQQKAAGGREPFALVFHGPLAPVLSQQIYALDHAVLGRLQIFLVPVGPAPARAVMQYEAVFA